METVDDPIGQKHPAGSQVTGRVARAHVAKVDHAAEIAVSRSEHSPGANPRAATEPDLSSQAQLSASSQTSRTASGSEINPRSVASFEGIRETFAAIGQGTTSVVPASRRVVTRGVM